MDVMPYNFDWFTFFSSSDQGRLMSGLGNGYYLKTVWDE